MSKVDAEALRSSIALLEAAQDEFLLFPDLPREIRLFVWEHALPGPRIVSVEAAPVPFPPPARVFRNDNSPDSSFGVPIEYRRFLELVECGTDSSSRETEPLALHYDPMTAKIVGLSRTAYKYQIASDAERLHIDDWNRDQSLLRGSEVPALLHTCRDAREVALRAFAFCFAIQPMDTSITFQKWDNFPSLERSYDADIVPHSAMASPGVRFQPSRDTICLPSPAAWPSMFARLEMRSTENIKSLAVPFEYHEVQMKHDFNVKGVSNGALRYPDLEELILFFNREDIPEMGGLSGDGWSALIAEELQKYSTQKSLPTVRVVEESVFRTTWGLQRT